MAMRIYVYLLDLFGLDDVNARFRIRANMKSNIYYVPMDYVSSQ